MAKRWVMTPARKAWYESKRRGTKRSSRSKGGGEYGAAFKAAYKRDAYRTKKGKLVKDPELRRMGTAFAHLEALTSVKTAAGRARAKKVADIMNRSYQKRNWTMSTYNPKTGTSETRYHGIYKKNATKVGKLKYHTLVGKKKR
jgi:hypothetical protein